MQSKPTLLDYLFIDTSLVPSKNFSGAKLFRANDVISIDHDSGLCFLVYFICS